MTNPEALQQMGKAALSWVATAASPTAVATQYEELFARLTCRSKPEIAR
jgi:hypothetical protein